MTAEGAQHLQELRTEILCQWRACVEAQGVSITPEMQAFLAEVTPALLELSFRSRLDGMEEGFNLALDLVKAIQGKSPVVRAIVNEAPNLLQSVLEYYRAEYGFAPHGP